MRSQDPPVLHARLGDVELWLPAEPIAPPVVAEAPPESPEDIERRDLGDLLHSSGADVTPFLRKSRAA